MFNSKHWDNIKYFLFFTLAIIPLCGDAESCKNYLKSKGAEYTFYSYEEGSAFVKGWNYKGFSLPAVSGKKVKIDNCNRFKCRAITEDCKKFKPELHFKTDELKGRNVIYNAEQLISAKSWIGKKIILKKTASSKLSVYNAVNNPVDVGYGDVYTVKGVNTHVKKYLSAYPGMSLEAENSQGRVLIPFDETLFSDFGSDNGKDILNEYRESTAWRRWSVITAINKLTDEVTVKASSPERHDAQLGLRCQSKKLELSFNSESIIASNGGIFSMFVRVDQSRAHELKMRAYSNSNTSGHIMNPSKTLIDQLLGGKSVFVQALGPSGDRVEVTISLDEANNAISHALQACQ